LLASWLKQASEVLKKEKKQIKKKNKKTSSFVKNNVGQKYNIFNNINILNKLFRWHNFRKRLWFLNINFDIYLHQF